MQLASNIILRESPYILYCFRDTYRGANNYMMMNIKTGGVVLIDLGILSSRSMNFVRNECITRLEAILITHGHVDHFGGLPILNSYDKVYTSLDTIQMMRDSKANLSKYTLEDQYLEISNPMNVIKDNLVSTRSFEISVYHTGGHTRGCVSYGIGPFLFTGDALIPNAKTALNLPSSDKAAYQKTLRNYISIIPNHEVLLPGHGKYFTDMKEIIEEIRTTLLD